MTDNWALQISVKIPHDNDNYRDTLVNLRAATPEELDNLLSFVSGKSAEIGSAVQTIRGGSAVGQVFPGPGTQQVQPDAATAAVQQAQSPQWGTAPQQAPPQWAAPQQAGPAVATGPAPGCVHGPMTPQSGTKNGRAWSAHFCPTPKGTQGQCDPVWGK